MKKTVLYGIISLIMIGIFMGSYAVLVSYDGKIYQKSSISRLTPDGISHMIDIYAPIQLEERVKPVVILIHGVGVSKEFFTNFAVEFAAQGYLAVCPELRGHGRSEGALTGIGFEFPNEMVIKLPDLHPLMNEINSTLQYLAARDDVDWNRISIIGHSMGGGTALLANIVFPDIFQSTVVIAPIPIWEINQTHPPNFLLIHGGLDEAFRLETEQELFKQTLPKSSLDADGNFEIGKQYGSFEDGSARKFILRPFDDHALEFVDPVVIRETRNWVNTAIITGDNIEPLLYTNRLGLISASLMGAIGAILFIAIALMNLKPHNLKELKDKSENQQPSSLLSKNNFKKSLTEYIFIAILGTIIGLLSFFAMYATGYLITTAILAPLIGYTSGLLLKYRSIRKIKQKNDELQDNPVKKWIPTDIQHLAFELGGGVLLGGFFALALYLTGGTYFVLTFPPIFRLGYAVGFGTLIFVILLIDDLFFVEMNHFNSGKMHILKDSVKHFLLQAPIIIATLLLELLFIENTFPLMFLALVLSLLFAINIIREIWHLHGIWIVFESLLFTIPVTGALVAMSSIVAL